VDPGPEVAGRVKVRYHNTILSLCSDGNSSLVAERTRSRERPAILAAEHAREATAIDGDCGEHFAALSYARAVLARHACDPDGAVFDQESGEFCGLTLISIAELIMQMRGDDVRVTMPARPERIASADLKFAVA
jgi:hypothetical protein